MLDAILIPGGGLLQVPAVSIAKEMGLHVVVTDRNPSAAAMCAADEPVTLDIYDIPGHLALVRDLKQRYNLRAVFTEGADLEVTVAAAAAEAGLPGIQVESAKNTKNKARSRRCLDEAGIANPRWAEVTTARQAEQEALRIGFPLMVKAVDNSASRGTTKVTGVHEIAPAFKRALVASSTGTVLLEQCFSGPEHSCEILFDANGRSHRLNIVDRPFAFYSGNAIELGHVNPTRLDRVAQDRIFALTESAAAAVGVTWGAFKSDIIWTEDGPRILEITARLSGGFDCQYTTPLATGRNFIRAAMCLALGMPIDPKDLTYRWHRYAAAWVGFPPPGRIEEIRGVDHALQQAGVKEVFLRSQVGDVIPPYSDCAARPIFVIAVGDTYDEAVENAKRGVRAVEIVTFPVEVSLT